MKTTFLEWYELFTEELYKKNYSRRIDKDRAREDYESGLSFKQSAKCFIEDAE